MTDFDIALVFLSTRPWADANGLGRVITDGSGTRRVSTAGRHIAWKLIQAGYAAAVPGKNRLRYAITAAGLEALEPDQPRERAA